MLKPLSCSSKRNVWLVALALAFLAARARAQCLSWSNEFAFGPNGSVFAATSYNDGSGPVLYVGGDFILIHGTNQLAHFVVGWNGTSWSNLGPGTNDMVTALGVYNSGNGPKLYVGGLFDMAGGQTANRIARWNGTTWSPLGNGISGSPGATVNVMATGNPGGGLASLFVGGSFSDAGGMIINYVARWNGTNWFSLGGGVSGGVYTTQVAGLCMFDDGGGPVLIAAGDFTMAGTIVAMNIARWDGTSWSSVGSGIGGQVSDVIVYGEGSMAYENPLCKGRAPIANRRERIQSTEMERNQLVICRSSE